jgi:hypothetical protein
MKRHFFFVVASLYLSTTGCGPAKVSGATATDDEQEINLAFVANINGPKSTQDSTPVTVVRPGKVTVDNALTRRDGSELSATDVKKESRYLRLYVTDYEPKNSKEIMKKKVWWWQNWQSSLTFEMPNSVANQKLRLFVTLVRVEPKTNKDTFVQITPIDLYVDGKGSGVTWLMRPQFIPAVKDTEIPLRVEVGSQGAPLEGAPVAESTTDGTTWSEIAIEKWTPIVDKTNVFTFLVRYPFAEEKPFRVRLKLKDTIGNQTVSDYSPNLVGRTDFNFVPATENERLACKDGANAGASKLVVMAPTTVLCRGRGSNGEATAVRKLPVVLDNRGAAPFKLAKDVTGLLGGLEYGLTAGGKDIRTVNVLHPALLTDELLKSPVFYNWELDLTRISASNRIWVTLDRNIVGKYSSSGTASQGNTCYAATPGYPTVELQNRATQLVLQDSVFPCDE